MQPSQIIKHYICHSEAYPSPASMVGMPVGSVITAVAPMTKIAFLPCDGQLVEIAEYRALFATIGHTYRISWLAPETWWQRLWRRFRGRSQEIIYEQLPEGMFRLPLFSIP